MKEGGQLELLALLSTVLGMNWKEAEQRKLRLRLAYNDNCKSASSWIDLLPFSLPKLAQQRFTR